MAVSAPLPDLLVASSGVTPASITAEPLTALARVPLEASSATPLLSIIVPVYNTDFVLMQRCFDSLNAAYDKRIEIIIVDDGSSQEHAEWINQASMHLTNKVQIIHQPNRGQTAARNSGINRALGEYVLFVDSDDYIDIHVLQNLLDHLVKSNIDILHFQTVYEQVRRPFTQLSCELSHYKYWTVTSKQKLPYTSGLIHAIYRKSLYQQYAYNAPRDIRIGEDLAISALMCMAGSSQEETDAPLYHYVIHEDSTSKVLRARRSLDTVTAIRFIIDQSQKHQWYKQYYCEIEFLAIEHIWYYGVSTAIQSSGPKAKDIPDLTEILNTMFPRWRLNPYLRKRKQHSIKYRLLAAQANFIYWLLFKAQSIWQQ